MNGRRRQLAAAPRFMSLQGILIGAVPAAVYWRGAHIWPTSIAVARAAGGAAPIAL
jgi:hypothetical protein